MTSQNPSSQLLQLISGHQIAQAIHVVASLRIADLLASGHRSSDDLAKATATHPRSLYRLMSALAAVGIFKELSDKCFELTPMGSFLRSDVVGSRRALAHYVGRSYVWASWGTLMHSVRTGETAFDHLYGSSIWDWRTKHLEESEIFDASMTEATRATLSAIVEAYDFSKFETVIDIGGGRGALLVELLTRNDQLRGVLFDLPHVVQDAHAALEAAGVVDRCQITSGDFFSGMPQMEGVYVFKNILMDENDEDAITLLKKCRLAMKGPSSRIMVIERTLGEPNHHSVGKFSDLNMLIMTGGRERTIGEFGALFDASGYRLEQQINAGQPAQLLIGAPV